VRVDYLTHYFDLPYTGGGEAVLPQGERVRVGYARGERPTGVYCDPLHDDELHARIVAEQERSNEMYRAYSLAIDTVVLNRSFKLIAEGGAGE
jgi:hypothetical protein